MKPTVVFVRVVWKPDYREGERRWMRSYLAHRPTIPHELVVIEQFAGEDNRDEEGDALFNPYTTIILRYGDGGWDCGAWQFAAKNIDAPMLLCFNSTTQIRGDGWLERFVDAFETHGEGLYGPMASLEVAPHIRTPCMAFSPRVMNEYTGQVHDRQATYQFESMGFDGGIPNVSLYTRQQGRPVKMVTWSGVYDLMDCRVPPNVFRSGDQSDLIVWDKHAEAYASSDAAGKAYLELLVKGR